MTNQMQEKVNVQIILDNYKRRIAELTHENVILEARINALQKRVNDDEHGKRDEIKKDERR